MKLLYLCIFMLYSVFGYGSDCERLFSRWNQEAFQLYGDIQAGLRSSKDEKRLKAIHQIRELQPIDTDVYRLMIPLLQDPNPQIRRAVIEIFGEHRVTDSDISHALIYYQESSADMRLTVEKSLKQISEELEQNDEALWKKIEEAITNVYKAMAQMTIALSRRNIPIKFENYSLVIQSISKKPEQQLSQEEKNILQAGIDIQNSIKKLKIVIYTSPFSSFVEFMKFIKYYKDRYNRNVVIEDNLKAVIFQIYSQFSSKL